MRIQHNITAMNAYRNYNNNTSAVAKNLEKLSSGYRINRAGDDAAGLAVSEKMRLQISGLEQAQKNAKSGISLVQTAEGALTEVHDMLNRMYTLAEQSANGTFDNETDRVQLQKEVESLRKEIDRIGKTANFNGIGLFAEYAGGSGGGGDKVAELAATVGTNDAKIGKVTFAYASDITDDDKKALNEALDGKKLTVTTTAKSSGSGWGTSSSAVKIDGVPTGYKLFYKDAKTGEETEYNSTNGIKVTTSATNAGEIKADTNVELILKKDDTAVATITINHPTEASSAANKTAEISFAEKAEEAEGGAPAGRAADDTPKATNTFTPDATAQASAKWSDIDVSKATGLTNGASVKFSVTKNSTKYDWKVTIGDVTYTKTGLTTADMKKNTPIELTSTDNGTVTVTIGNNDITAAISEAPVGTVKVEEAEDKKTADGIWFAIGAEPDDNNKLTLGKMHLGPGKIGLADDPAAEGDISGIDISDQNKAWDALAEIKKATNAVSDMRGTLGSIQNRLDHTINNLSVMQENMQDAESVIRDTDIADEMMAYTKNNILVQSAQAMLAQANQLPQGVLQLLQ